MAIRSRIITFPGLAVTTSQTGLVIGAVRIPKIARVKGVSATAVGAGAGDTVGVYQSPGVVDDTAANSTTLIHDAVIAVIAADTPLSDPMTGQYRIAAGTWLYFKATTVGTGYTALSVQVELDY